MNGRLPDATERLQRLGGWLAGAPSEHFRLIVFGLYALHVVTGLAAHAMWRDETQAWLIVRDSADLFQLAHNLAYEGHPIGWYLLIWPLRFLGPDPAWMQVAQAACALGAAALLLWRGPFSRLELVLLLLSYPLFFEYAVKSRSYALGTLLLFAFCSAFVARKPVLRLAALLALLMNVHVLFGLIAAGGFAAVVVRRLREEGWRHGLRRSDLPAFLVLSLGAALALAIARQPADSGFATTWAFDVIPDHVLRTAHVLAAFLKGPTFPGPDFPLSSFLGLALIALILARTGRAPAAAAFFATSVAALLMFMHVKYGPAPWHHALLFVVLVAAVWMARGREGLCGPALVPPVLFAAVLVVQAASGVRAAVDDRRFDYSSARETARLLRQANLASAPLFALRDVAASPVVAYLRVPSAFYGPGMREGSFVIWDTARLAPVDIAAVIDRAETAVDPVVLDCGDRIADGPPPDPRLVEWRRVQGVNESCVIYRIAG